MTVHALSLHADWRCARSGACCTSGWPIPVERVLDARLRRALRARVLDVAAGRAPGELLRRAPGLDPEHASLTAVDQEGCCVFFEPAGRGASACGLQRQLGPRDMPLACRLFPRVCLLEPRGVSITLSHYCPSAAARLLDDGAPLAIVRAPPSFPDDGPYEGLDARAALPPLLRPDALLDWDTHARFEAHAVAVLGRGGLAPEAALDRLAWQAERVRAWRAEAGPLGEWAATALEARVPDEPGLLRRLHALEAGSAGDLALFRRVLACVPTAARALLRDAAGVPADAARLGVLDARHVAPAWGALAQPVGRYLAARAFAAWSAHQGRGLRTRVLDLAATLGVLRVQAARVCAAAQRVLDRALFVEAVRAADLLLCHLVSREELAASLSACEERPWLE